MRLLAVELHDLRNLAAALIEPHARMNVLAGQNGQGKTNFLEAVYLLGTLRSFRAARLDELVRFEAPALAARARVERRGLERLYEVEVTRQPRAKRARVDGKGVRSADYFGGFNVVLFSPEDLALVRGAPPLRRRFLDRAVWNAEPAFLADAQTYDRLLRSRNALLRDGSAARRPELLEVYDGELARAGAAVTVRRRRYLDALAPLVARAYERITASGRALAVAHASRLPAGSAADPGALLAALVADRRRDLARGHTHAGPHTDDVELLLDGRPARAHASQGQTRALVLALKVAEIEHLAATLGEPPILLLDDVSSELDAERTQLLFEFVAGLACQAFVTTTAPRSLPLPAERLEFQVVGGTIRQ